MKKTKTILLLLAVWTMATGVWAQQRTTMATHYPDFRPSVITLTDGRRLQQPLTNIFLKNSSLLYMKGEHAMEANMSNIAAVEFADRHYVNIAGGQLGYFIDSVRGNSLYCIEILDQESYERNLRNNVNITSIDMGVDQLGTTSVDLNNETDYQFPIIPKFYFQWDGTYVKAHEREIWRRIKDKEKRRLYKSVIGADDFSWLKPESLMQLLRVISE